MLIVKIVGYLAKRRILLDMKSTADWKTGRREYGYGNHYQKNGYKKNTSRPQKSFLKKR